MTPLKFSALFITCDRAMKAACPPKGRLRSIHEIVPVEEVKPSAVFFIVLDLPRSLGKRSPSRDSFLPRLACGPRCTRAATDGSVPASVITAP